MDDIYKLLQAMQKELLNKIVNNREILSSKQYKDSASFLKSYTFDFINAIRIISIYSTRWNDFYSKSLAIQSIDDFIQSAIAIKFEIESGIFNPAKRELRYMIELAVKSLYVDQSKGQASIEEKISFLHNEVPRSSIDYSAKLGLPFSNTGNKDFLDDLNLYYSQVCEYVHPSKKQIEEQILNFSRGNTIGFETARMLESNVNLVFKFYDLILVLIFTAFGYQMSRDLFEQVFGENSKWKFHKGKHTKLYFTRNDS